MCIHVVGYAPVLCDSIWHVVAADKVGRVSKAEATFSGDCVAGEIMAGATVEPLYKNTLHKNT
jgi:hypothetical protein